MQTVTNIAGIVLTWIAYSIGPIMHKSNFGNDAVVAQSCVDTIIVAKFTDEQYKQLTKTPRVD